MEQFGGLAVSNFKLYFQALSFRPLLNWFDSDSEVPWINMEKNMVAPSSLQDILFTDISLKQCRLRFGPIIAHAVSIWRKYEKLYNWNTKWHAQTPLFHNPSLHKGGLCFVAHQWANSGIHALSDVMEVNGLRTFSDLKETYNLPGTSLFLYLQLRSAMQAYGVSWSQPPIHPVTFIKKYQVYLKEKFP